MTMTPDVDFQTRVARVKSEHSKRSLIEEAFFPDPEATPVRDMSLQERLWIALLYIPVGIAGGITAHAYVAHPHSATLFLGIILGIFILIVGAALFLAAITGFSRQRLSFALSYTLLGFFAAVTAYCC